MVTEGLKLPTPEESSDNAQWAELASPFPGNPGMNRAETPTVPPPLMEMPAFKAPERKAVPNVDAARERVYAVEAPEPVPMQAQRYENTLWPRNDQEVVESVSATSVGEYQLSERELMRVAKDIRIDGIRLKDVFEAGRIDEAGLRAVVAEYMRGGDVRQQLTRELVSRERSYERDPSLRSRQPEEHEFDQGTAMAGGSADLQQNLGVAATLGAARRQSNMSTRQESQLGRSVRRGLKSVGELLSHSAKIIQRDLIDNSNTTDWISITAVVVLWSIILVLLLG